ncbi:hypothetical protein [Tsukamurella soli]|uniref:Oligoendopeptidase F n=1 Tax=Tsukamurella soli TaxID=644556 RepID=A0ABP8K8T0_9ACTN
MNSHPDARRDHCPLWDLDACITPETREHADAAIAIVDARVRETSGPQEQL